MDYVGSQAIFLIFLIESSYALPPNITGRYTARMENSNRYIGPLSARKVLCCQRHPKIITIGHDDSAKPVHLDVGRCKKSCHTHKRLITDANDGQRCPPDSVCQPSLFRVHRSHLKEGPSTHDVIESCECLAKTTSCQRQEKWMTFYQGTVHERTIDVGRCGGYECGNGNMCKASHLTSISLQGPDGAHCEEITNQCACLQNCDRISKIDEFVVTRTNSTTGRLFKQTVKLDVGQCAGDCTNQEGYKCVMWSPDDKNVCLMSLKKRRTACMPISHKTHRLDATNQESVALSVEKCGCR